jgi:DNA-binding NarL/FixJ family response regulator
VLIMDDSPHTANLLKALKRLLEAHPGLAVIVVMQRPTASVTQKLLAVGVRALLHKKEWSQKVSPLILASPTAWSTGRSTAFCGRTVCKTSLSLS